MEATLETLRPQFASQYQLERELGRGGMGIVFLARELTLDRLVAIKVLPPAMAGDAALRERFIREARTAAQLSHPNIVPIFRADAIDGTAFFAMGYIDGETAAERLAARGALPAQDVVRIVREVSWALAYAHARGVVHRDIKPENIMIERGTGRVMVTDFGIARDARATGMTADGMVLGSVHYMAPERVAGGEADGRSDLYSLGVVAFQLLSGRLPFDAPQASAVLLMQATRPAPAIGDLAPGIPAPLAAVIDRCLAKDPAHRYPTGEALAEALDDALRQVQSGPQAVSQRVLDEATAKAIWLRAAQLQADASRRVRERTAQAEEFATGLHSAVPTTGYRLDDVEAAAVEAGIGEEFVQLALAELPDDEAQLPARLETRESRFQRLVLGNVEHSMRVSRVIPASPRALLEAIGRIFPAHPNGLMFRDTVGGHPLDGGVLTFTAKPISSGDYVAASGLSTLRYYLTVIDAYLLRVTLHPISGDPRRCELVITTDLRPGMNKNAKVGFGIGAAMGGGGAAVGIALAAAKGAALLAAPVGIGALAVVGAGMLGVYRWGYRWGLNKARKELEGLIDQVQSSARSQDVFGSVPPPPPPPEATGDGGVGVLLSGL
ncbi:MAG TPA: serine/threonine-protein kinase [Gemmatimonadales bacterium]|nr:serine/threonine protein kinase [Gemmatimonadota bacterium]MCB9505541.1 serine/threonine protein kinase [Gemmatimonadales bacterium]HPF61324.1 serine/threonine-protein kinase [Gemmatimonadales bacterium]HRX19499.1 serine/threonine-protein kinase [Gemmatimonadales bacterium]